MSKVLITGAAGFLGLQVSRRLLESDHEVYLIDNLQRGVQDSEFAEVLSHASAQFIQLDLTHPTALNVLDGDFDQVYHFAAMLGVERVLKAPYEVLSTNASSMQNVLDWARGLENLRRFVFSSTSEIYAGTRSHYAMPVPTPETVHITLESVEKPRTSYALSKAYGEALLHASGLPLTILRYHNIYGPRMGFDHVIPQITGKIINNSVVSVPSADHTRAFCFIEDAVTQTIAAANSENTVGVTLNVGNSSEEIRIEDLVRKIAKALKHEISIIAEPATEGSPDRRCPDTSRMTELTGVSAQISLDEGLERTCAWYLPHYSKASLA